MPRTEGELDEGVDPLIGLAADGGASSSAGATATAAAEALTSSSSSGKRRAKGKGRGADSSDDDDSDDDNKLEALTTGNLMFHSSNKADPHLKVREEDEEIDSEVDDFEISPTDLVLLGARSDEQLSNLEAYVYEEEADNLYPHHDVQLPVFPLCLAWLDFAPGGGGGGGGRNFAAVGTFAPYIEVWDLDVIDALEPVAVLGAEAAAAAAEEQFTSHAAEALAASERQKGGGEGKRAGRKKKKTAAAGSARPDAPEGHSDAVMCLGWNPLQRNCLASGSADTTVRLWDLEGSCAGSLSALRHHSDKVQTLAWHPTEAPALLSAGFDRRAIAVDVRTPDGSPHEWALSADAERVAWSPSGTSFIASTEDGYVRRRRPRLLPGRAERARERRPGQAHQALGRERQCADAHRQAQHAAGRCVRPALLPRCPCAARRGRLQGQGGCVEHP